MHDDMQYDPIQGQGLEPFKVGNPTVFKSYLLRQKRLNGSRCCLGCWLFWA